VPTRPATVDPKLCPLCGQPNLCAMEIEQVTGVKPEACWCTHLDFNAELLAQVPAEAESVACICAACAGKPRAA
jgi:hypothetical protein